MKANTYTSNNNFTQNQLMVIWTFCVLFFICILKSWLNHNIPSTKTDFAKWYGVDKKTFNKWIKHFCTDLYDDISVYQRKRKLSKDEAKAIIAILGRPQSYPILSKKEIVHVSQSNYRVLRQCVQQYSNHFGITPITYKVNQKFPPKISRKIMEHFDPDRLDWVWDREGRLANGDDFTPKNKKHIN